MQAQSKHAIKLNNDILTHNGDIAITSTDGAIKMADDTILSAGNQNIMLAAGGDVDLQHLMTTAKIAVTSGANATFGKTLTGLNNQGIGEFAVDAGGNVVLNGLRSNSAVTVSADGLIDVLKPVFTGGDVNLAGKTLTVESGAGISTKGSSGNVTGKTLNLIFDGQYDHQGQSADRQCCDQPAGPERQPDDSRRHRHRFRLGRAGPEGRRQHQSGLLVPGFRRL